MFPREQGLNILDCVGNTPLLQLPTGEHCGTIWAKAEWANPGGSVKDRAALRMIEEAERSGRLTPERVLIDATSGNTGIAYALICAAKGYRLELCLPSNASAERKKILRALGAELILTSPLEMTDGAILEARRRVSERPDHYFYPDQYSNPANWEAHYLGTAREIWQQTQGRLTHFVAGVGTSGTLMGVGQFLREQAPHVRLVEMQPDSPYHGLEGLKHMDSAMVPSIYRPELADERVQVTTEEAQAECRRLARQAGWFVGVSAAANVVAARRVAQQQPEAFVVTILCDGGVKYLSDSLWDEP